jgi:hypothetical protein
MAGTSNGTFSIWARNWRPLSRRHHPCPSRDRLMAGYSPAGRLLTADQPASSRDRMTFPCWGRPAGRAGGDHGPGCPRPQDGREGLGRRRPHPVRWSHAGPHGPARGQLHHPARPDMDARPRVGRARPRLADIGAIHHLPDEGRVDGSRRRGPSHGRARVAQAQPEQVTAHAVSGAETWYRAYNRHPVPQTWRDIIRKWAEHRSLSA